MTLIKTENKIKTKSYTKETWSCRYLNFNSNHPNAQKNSIIIGLSDRAIKLTSPEYRYEILKQVKSTLQSNHYLEPTKQQTAKFFEVPKRFRWRRLGYFQRLNKKF